MGLDMYIWKLKKHPIFEDKTMADISSDIYDFEELKDKDRLLYEALSPYTFRFTNWEHEGEKTTLECKVAYWRKANEVHNYIYTHFKNFDDQKDYEYIMLKKENLEKLYNLVVDLIQRVDTPELAQFLSDWENGKFRDISEAEWEEKVKSMDEQVQKSVEILKEKLPTTRGFFFGSVEYDMWYYSDLKKTEKQLKQILAETDFDNEFLYYHASY